RVAVLRVSRQLCAARMPTEPLLVARQSCTCPRSLTTIPCPELDVAHDDLTRPCDPTAMPSPFAVALMFRTCARDVAARLMPISYPTSVPFLTVTASRGPSMSSMPAPATPSGSRVSDAHEAVIEWPCRLIVMRSFSTRRQTPQLVRSVVTLYVSPKAVRLPHAEMDVVAPAG